MFEEDGIIRRPAPHGSMWRSSSGRDVSAKTGGSASSDSTPVRRQHIEDNDSVSSQSTSALRPVVQRWVAEATRQANDRLKQDVIQYADHMASRTSAATHDELARTAEVFRQELTRLSMELQQTVGTFRRDVVMVNEKSQTAFELLQKDVLQLRDRCSKLEAGGKATSDGYERVAHVAAVCDKLNSDVAALAEQVCNASRQPPQDQGAAVASSRASTAVAKQPRKFSSGTQDGEFAPLQDMLIQLRDEQRGLAAEVSTLKRRVSASEKEEQCTPHAAGGNTPVGESSWSTPTSRATLKRHGGLQSVSTTDDGVAAAREEVAALRQECAQLNDMISASAEASIANEAMKDEAASMAVWMKRELGALSDEVATLSGIKDTVAVMRKELSSLSDRVDESPTKKEYALLQDWCEGLHKDIGGKTTDAAAHCASLRSEVAAIVDKMEKLEADRTAVSMTVEHVALAGMRVAGTTKDTQQECALLRDELHKLAAEVAAAKHGDSFAPTKDHGSSGSTIAEIEAAGSFQCQKVQELYDNMIAKRVASRDDVELLSKSISEAKRSTMEDCRKLSEELCDLRNIAAATPAAATDDRDHERLSGEVNDIRSELSRLARSIDAERSAEGSAVIAKEDFERLSREVSEVRGEVARLASSVSAAERARLVSINSEKEKIVTLRFESLKLDSIDHDAFIGELVGQLRDFGVDDAHFTRLKITLREGSVIADVRGLSAAAEVVKAKVKDTPIVIMGAAADLVEDDVEIGGGDLAETRQAKPKKKRVKELQEQAEDQKQEGHAREPPAEKMADPQRPIDGEDEHEKAAVAHSGAEKERLSRDTSEHKAGDEVVEADQFLVRKRSSKRLSVRQSPSAVVEKGPHGTVAVEAQSRQEDASEGTAAGSDAGTKVKSKKKAKEEQTKSKESSTAFAVDAPAEGPAADGAGEVAEVASRSRNKTPAVDEAQGDETAAGGEVVKEKKKKKKGNPVPSNEELPEASAEPVAAEGDEAPKEKKKKKKRASQVVTVDELPDEVAKQDHAHPES